tara:strand:+ start:20 stop:295 length:276 start_codon:yes stop_codon:yes gene_type:complete
MTDLISQKDKYKVEIRYNDIQNSFNIISIEIEAINQEVAEKKALNLLQSTEWVHEIPQSKMLNSNTEYRAKENIAVEQSYALLPKIKVKAG